MGGLFLQESVDLLIRTSQSTKFTRRRAVGWGEEELEIAIHVPSTSSVKSCVLLCLFQALNSVI